MNKWPLQYWNQKPLIKWAGVTVVKTSNGKSKVLLKVEDHHREAAETDSVNEATPAYIHDITQALSVCSMLSTAVTSTTTINLNEDFVELMSTHDSLYYEGLVTKVGKHVAFSQSEFRDTNDRICSKSTGSFRIQYRTNRVETQTISHSLNNVEGIK
jgi:acyl-coenzyme A thioesterase PaaI-like protein